jgi:PncC family amidohydrolase
MYKPHHLRRLMLEKKLTLALAESVTGGALAAAITTEPGASDFFKGGVVAYSNQSKTQLLGVSSEILDINGAVSLPCVGQMAKGARDLFDADVALATTGFAGPERGDENYPVGTIFMAIMDASGLVMWEKHFAGNRQSLIHQAVEEILARFVAHVSAY